jgi:hypothetical protein
MSDDRWFERLAEATAEAVPERAPARLKSRTYSAVIAQMVASEALLELTETRKAGGRLCVFETALTVLPLGSDVRSMNPCRICHARILGERLEHAPIFWPGCPYSDFHHG